MRDLDQSCGGSERRHFCGAPGLFGGAFFAEDWGCKAGRVERLVPLAITQRRVVLADLLGAFVERNLRLTSPLLKFRLSRLDGDLSRRVPGGDLLLDRRSRNGSFWLYAKAGLFGTDALVELSAARAQRRLTRLRLGTLVGVT